MHCFCSLCLVLPVINPRRSAVSLFTRRPYALLHLNTWCQTEWRRFVFLFDQRRRLYKHPHPYPTIRIVILIHHEKYTEICRYHHHTACTKCTEKNCASTQLHYSALTSHVSNNYKHNPPHLPVDGQIDDNMQSALQRRGFSSSISPFYSL